MQTSTDGPEHLRQPLLDRERVVLAAPTQVWSSRDGDAWDMPVHGLFHGDSRILSGLRLRVSGEVPEAIGHYGWSGELAFEGIVRAVDDPTPDPRVRVLRTRSVRAGEVTERIRIDSGLDEPVRAAVVLELRIGMAELGDVKAGLRPASAHEFVASEPGAHATATDGRRRIAVTAEGAHVQAEGDIIRLRWECAIAPRGQAEVAAVMAVGDALGVFGGYDGDEPWRPLPPTGDLLLARWSSRARADLGALLMSDPASGDAFRAAGSPWFFTLFGRDSLIAARFLLPQGPELAWGTLRTLASRQGTKVDIETAEQPGKILHEVRSSYFDMPGEGIHLPPLYYGTIDATPLWIILLHGAWRHGIELERIRELQPALEAALAWLRDDGCPDDTGFLKYIDESGHGLANQGWKDSGDSIRFSDGRIAEGPIALCEVQGQAYQAAVLGAELLDALGADGGDAFRDWAEALKQRFRREFWVERRGLRFPAIALDGHGEPVDSLTSNIGQLVGTGILDADEEKAIADLLIDPRLSSGFGLRTMASDEAAYWPLSYHCGTVWPHDTAVAIEGLLASGFRVHARDLARQLLVAAESFAWRLPELYSGEPADRAGKRLQPARYPAACRPQAWAAAAVVPVHRALTE
ncbi:glycogen debranching N-terminal domain-containing protein [Microbacterium sediminis]|uniref:Amylo-alpha-1,6-glucosidase n=1 Tax=Microbacterium sediminis TaxID=904291 RepID=A0A1B9NA88_9MICO|nr:glycogen debranching N-terminal domain-containing protein [Microbacterium sediminis]OCG73515.1 hypothetical protein A7J15_07475 [Microbacterium sediminis]